MTSFTKQKAPMPLHEITPPTSLGCWKMSEITITNRHHTNCWSTELLRAELRAVWVVDYFPERRSTDCCRNSTSHPQYDNLFIWDIHTYMADTTTVQLWLSVNGCSLTIFLPQLYTLYSGLYLLNYMFGVIKVIIDILIKSSFDLFYICSFASFTI